MRNNICFFMFPSIFTFDFCIFGVPIDYCLDWDKFQNCFWVVYWRWKRFIFCASFNYSFCFWPNSRVFLGFLVYSYCWTTLNFICFLQLWLLIWLNFRLVLDLWGSNGLLLGSYRIQNSFWVYSCIWTTFIFSDSFNSDFSLWLSYGVVFDFWGLNMLFLGTGSDSNTDFAPTHVVEQLSFFFNDFFNFDFSVWLNFGIVFEFLPSSAKSQV